MKKNKQVFNKISNDLGENEKLLIDLMDSHGENLLRLAFTYVKDWGKAEDIVQEVFITCFTKHNSFRGDASIKTWLYRITVNKCKDHLKSWSFRNINIDQLFLKTQKTKSKDIPEFHLIKKDENQILSNFIFSLPLKYREVIILHYYEEFSLKKISELLNVKLPTIKVRLSRARILLKKMYEKKGEIDEWKKN